MCIWLNKQEKYENKQRQNNDFNFASNKWICMKNGDFLRHERKICKGYIKEF
jgi:hypothetical protein